MAIAEQFCAAKCFLLASDMAFSLVVVWQLGFNKHFSIDRSTVSSFVHLDHSHLELKIENRSNSIPYCSEAQLIRHPCILDCRPM